VSGKPAYDWNNVYEQARSLIESGECKPQFAALARALNISRPTIQQAFLREFGLYAADLKNLASKSRSDEVESVEPDGNGDVKIKVKGNSMTVEGGKRITTLKQLIEAAEIDLDEWEIERHVINKWEVAGKFGHAGSEHFELQDLRQVKAWLVRRKPVAQEPVVSPVVLKIQAVKKPQPKKADWKIALGLFDPHVGFLRDQRTADLTALHDRAALDVSLQLAQDLKPDVLAFGGDWLDLAEWSDKFARSPDMWFTTQPAVIEAAWWMAHFKMTSPDARTVMIPGNHENRLVKSLLSHMLQAYDLRSADGLDLPPLLSIERLLGLQSMGIEYTENYPDGSIWLNDQVEIEHGDVTASRSGATATKVVEDSVHTRIFGHIHRTELAYKTLRGSSGYRRIAAFSPGCLCHVDGRVPGAGKDTNWQQGIAVIYFKDDGEHIIHPVGIDNGMAFFQGRLYEAREDACDELDEIVKQAMATPTA